MTPSGALALALVAFLEEHRRCWLLYAPDVPSLDGRDEGIYAESLGPGLVLGCRGCGATLTAVRET